MAATHIYVCTTCKLADEAGVVFVPFARAADVLAQAQKIDMGDNRQKKDIDAGVDMATLAATQYK